MSDAHHALLDDVYACARCDAPTFGFELAEPGAGYYKFPATIGATAAASILFVGINPRRSESNARLHQDVMRSAAAFRTLAGNRIPDSRGRPIRRYIDRHGTERHYDLHVEIVETAFGVSARFEDYAAVTELLLCASASSPPVDLTTSPCAKAFLARTVDQVRPEVIVGVGAAVDEYFRSRATRRGDLVFRAVIAAITPGSSRCRTPTLAASARKRGASRPERPAAGSGRSSTTARPQSDHRSVVPSPAAGWR